MSKCYPSSKFSSTQFTITYLLRFINKNTSKMLFMHSYIHCFSKYNIRVVQLEPVHPAAQRHFPGDTHVPPLEQPCGHIARTDYINITK